MDKQNKEQASSLSSFIWKVADDLWGDFKHVDFARIMIPLLLLRRLECVLEPTKKQVLEAYAREKDSGVDLDLVLPSFSGFPFYNTSNLSLETLGATHTRDNLVSYISSFSSNVRVVFEEFGFISSTIDELDKAKLLYRMTKHFANIDLHPDAVSNRVLSNAYEDIIRKFAASINEKAGEFMTPKDVVHLTTKLVLSPDEEIFNESGVIRSVYDPTCGLMGFITDALDLILDMNPNAKVIPFGQELDPKTHAMALTSMLIQGFEAKNVQQGSTLSSDKFPQHKFHYGLANPPFGIKWDKDKAVVEREHKTLGHAGRFAPGLPRVSDGSMLFLMHLVSKMEAPENGGGRVGIVLSGSPLFTGGAGSGESEIRRWLMENDYVEAIVSLPTDLFFNTGIGTYVWLLTNKKTPERKGRVQLIDLKDTWSQMRKSEGMKRRYLNDDQIDDVVRLYDSFKEAKNVKIFDYTDFAYRRVAVKRPLRGKLVVDQAAIADLQIGKNFQKLAETEKHAWIEFFQANHGEHDYDWAHQAVKENNKKGNFGKATKALGTEFTNTFFVKDEASDPIKNDKGEIIPDNDLNDFENVPFHQDIDQYFEEEVLPHVPDAFIDYSYRDENDGGLGVVGYEINFNRYFYEYVPPRDLHEIDADLKASESRIRALLNEVAG